jgi:CDP-diglyceride synthetase
MKNFIERLLTGTLYVVLLTACIVWSRYTYLVLFSIVVPLCLWEFYGLINAQKRTRINVYYNCLGGLLLFVSSFLFASGTFGYYIFFPYLLYVVIVLISELYEKQQDPITHMAYIFLGQCYVAIPFAVLNLIAFHPLQERVITYNWILILSLFVFIWVNDTGAYLIGILFGKRRLFERISPKKSWEGFFGGLVFTIASSLLFAYFVPAIPYYHWIGLSFSIVVFGTWGDLIESLIKRTLSVKDSGQTLPGHGGYLDRMDSMLLAVYAMLFYVQLFIYQG